MILPARHNPDRNNNFNLLRILAAVAVLVSHAYPISFGPGTAEPLDHVLGMSLGTLAVLSFFAISGYFISQSFHNSRSVIDFVTARILRIYPGLLTVLVLTVFCLGPVFTTSDLVTYFSDRQTLLYIPRNLILWRLQYELPGVFRDNVYPAAINGSLWTLVYEVGCYAMVAAIGLLGLTLNRRRFLGFVTAYGVCYVAAIPLLRGSHDHLAILRNVHLLSLPFLIGMSLFHFREQLPPRLPTLMILGTASALAYGSVWFHELFVLAWSYGIFYLGFLKYQPLQVYNRLGDYSYGMYIYAFPIEQIVAALYKECTPLTMIMLSLPLTLFFAILSWHGIEKRALTQKSAVSKWLSSYIVLGWAR